MKEKISKSHTTLIEPAEKIIKKISKLEEVKKITLGPIVSVKNKNSKKIRAKLKKNKTSLELKVVGNFSVQTFYIFSEKLDLAEREILEILEK